MPKLASIFIFVSIASLGLPGLAGFWGEVMALLSSYKPAAGLSVGLFRGFMVAGGIGTVLTAGYFLWMIQRVNLGVIPDKWKETALSDTLTVEWVAWVPLLVLIVVLGLFPRLIFGTTDNAVQSLMHLMGL
jgi:NADH-quinone oxidoreductase subunit M